jgi:transposase-like protein
MLNKIRNELMQQDHEPLFGEVEVDETAGGAKHARAGESRRGLAMRRRSDLPTIWGAVERGGRIKVKVVKSRASADIEGPLWEFVLPSSMIFTDEWKGYDHGRISAHYRGHQRIRHEDRIYVQDNVHTQTIEGFFGLMKNGIRGTYHAVSSKWLQSYCDEFAWRYSERNNGRSMFRSLVKNAANQ